MNISVHTKNMRIFEALASETRVRVLEVLMDGDKNIGELAKILGVSSSIMTRHISILENSGFVQTRNVPGKRGLQKKCSLALEQITLVLSREKRTDNIHLVSIPVGQYKSYDVTPTCGLASRENYIGIIDDPRYFSDPNRVHASLIWFQSGWVEYEIPGYVLPYPSPKSIEIALEISSEYPLYKEDWPSDIYFYINNVLLGYWTSPGDFGKSKGIYTPEWWRGNSEYGLLKTIRVTDAGSRIDGITLSDITLRDLNLSPNKNLTFRIESPPDAQNPGGINIFGRGFGNYDQDISIRVSYD